MRGARSVPARPDQSGGSMSRSTTCLQELLEKVVAALGLFRSRALHERNEQPAGAARTIAERKGDARAGTAVDRLYLDAGVWPQHALYALRRPRSERHLLD